ncbi:MAG TPA: hypothetical protein PKN33_03550 [Phycisphaerae bacterium]|nr:hypothetical protein [Phycisphaerae bacterium]
MRICLDSNCLRDEDLINKAASEASASGGSVVLPDILLGEIVKSLEWRETFKKSLDHLKAISKSVIVFDSVAEKMRQEEKDGVGCEDLYDEALTLSFRKFLKELENDEDAALDSIKNNISEAKSDVQYRLRSAVAVHASTLDTLDVWKKLLPDKIKKDLRKGNDDTITMILNDKALVDICTRTLIANGFGDETAKKLSKSDSVCRRNVLAHYAVTLRWLATGGAESRREGQVQNDYMDLEVVVAGTYCTENRSKDKVVQQLDAILRPLFGASS